jgi:hypothetical protein
MAIEFVDDDKDLRVIKCVVLTQTIVDKVKAIVAQYPGTNQSAVICKILLAYFESRGEA